MPGIRWPSSVARPRYALSLSLFLVKFVYPNTGVVGSPAPPTAAPVLFIYTLLGRLVHVVEPPPSSDQGDTSPLRGGSMKGSIYISEVATPPLRSRCCLFHCFHLPPTSLLSLLPPG
ncbi:hypothetical protein F5X96DRAFT_618511 [Biscogniauxia mediterranea]|nr:hypothetical protein F5X96DRAFT_618511 [Biscogniauxia mediterranea]